MNKVTKRVGESGTKMEPSSTPTPSPADLNDEKPQDKPTKLTVPHSVQFLQPTRVLNLGDTMNQIGRSQALIVFGYGPMGVPGVWFESHDERIKQRTFVPFSSVRGTTVEEVDPA